MADTDSSEMATPLNLSTTEPAPKSRRKAASLEDCVTKRWQAATLKAIQDNLPVSVTNDHIDVRKLWTSIKPTTANAGQEKTSDNLENNAEKVKETKTESASILDHYRSFMQRIPAEKREVKKTKSRSKTDKEYKPAGHKLTSEKRRSKRKSRRTLSHEEDCFEAESFKDDLNFSFPSLKSDLSSIHSYVTNSTIPERTIRQNNWALKVWKDWADRRNSNLQEADMFREVPTELDDASVDDMGYWLPRFIKEVRRRDGRHYPGETLMQIASGLQRYLRHVAGRQDMTFFDKYSTEFDEFRETLKSKMVTARPDFNGSIDNTMESTSPKHGETDLFNLDTAKGLFRAIFYCNCVDFQIVNMEEHHELQAEQFTVSQDQDKKDYVEYTSANPGVGKIRKYRSTRNNVDLVSLYRIYLSRIPSNGPLYRRPLLSSETEGLRFSFNPVGINKLRSTYKLMFTADNKTMDSAKIKKCLNKADSNHDSITPTSSFNGSESNSPLQASIKNETVINTNGESSTVPVRSQPPAGPSYPIASEDDSTLIINVPNCIKTIIIQRGKKKIKVDITPAV